MNYRMLKEVIDGMTEYQLNAHVVIRTEDGEFHPMHDVEPSPKTVRYEINGNPEWNGKLTKGHPLIVYMRTDGQYAGLQQENWKYGELLSTPREPCTETSS